MRSRIVALLCVCLIVFDLCSIGTAIWIWRNGEWHTPLIHFLASSWNSFLSREGSSLWGFVSGLLVALLEIVAVLAIVNFLHEDQSMKERLKHVENAAIALAILAILIVLVYGTQFAWELTNTAHLKHAALTEKLKAYRDAESPHCWLKNIGMKPPSALPNGQHSGNLVVFFCNTEYEAPLSIEWDFSSPHPRKIGVPFFPDNRAMNQNVVTYGDDHIVSFIEAPNLAKFQPTLLEIFSDKSIPPQVYRVEIRRMEKDKAVTPIEIKADDIR